MRNLIISLLIVLPILVGCGLADRVQKAVTESGSNSNTITITNVNSNKTLTDTAVDAAVGEKKIGIPECDEALDILSAQANDPDDSFVTKAVKKTALNTFRDRLKQNLEENKTDKKEVAKFCKEFRDGLADSATEQSNSNGKK